MNIFTWARNHDVIFIENIEWWLLNNAKPLFKLLHFSFGYSSSKKADENRCRRIFNQICLNQMHVLVRLIGFGDDGEDYYYITKDIKGRVVWESMVGTIIPLKGRISNWDYSNIQRQFDGWEGYVTSCPPEKEFLSAYEPTEFAIKHYGALPK